MIIERTDLGRRAATAADEPYLRELFAESRDDLALLPEQVRESLIAMQYDARRAQYAVTHPDATDEILVVAGQQVGRLLTEGCHIVDIAIARPHRRRGIATTAIREVLESNAPHATTLNVWSANHAARALYERLGFEVSDDGEGYLSMTYRWCGS